MSSKLPAIVYKYRDWSNQYHRKILVEQELYVASPKDFNDPLDCRITPNFGLLNTDDKILEYVKTLSERNRKKLEARGQKPEDHESRIFDRIKHHRHEEQERWNKFTFKQQDDHYGVVSLSEQWDSVLMWGHYASNHSGFCVGFHESKLQDSGLFGRGGMVEYTDIFPEINPKDDFTPERGFVETHTKAVGWSYEKEYRLFKLFHEGVPTSELRKIKVDKSFYAEINIGMKFPDDQIREVIKISSDLGVPLYHVKQVPFEFRLTRDRLV